MGFNINPPSDSLAEKEQTPTPAFCCKPRTALADLKHQEDPFGPRDTNSQVDLIMMLLDPSDCNVGASQL